MKPPISSSSSSSASCAFAEIASARKPILSDSPSATTPRMTGQRRIRLRFAQETIGSEVTSNLALGVRHATDPGRDAAHHHALEHRLAADAARRRTRPACRPASARTEPRRRVRTWRPSAAATPFDRRHDAGSSLGVARLGGATTESLDASTGVNQLLLARVERVALCSRSRRGARAWSSACRSRCRTSSGRARGRIRDVCLSSSRSESSQAPEHGREPQGAPAGPHVDIQPVGQIYIQPVCELEPGGTRMNELSSQGTIRYREWARDRPSSSSTACSSTAGCGAR